MPSLITKNNIHHPNRKDGTMKKDEVKTKVIFRYWKNSVIAIFPEEMGDHNLSTCSSYQHMGQHGACYPQLIIDNSRPAKPGEYKCLQNELENMGYNLKIIKKYFYSHYETRSQKINSLNKE